MVKFVLPCAALLLVGATTAKKVRGGRFDWPESENRCLCLFKRFELFGKGCCKTAEDEGAAGPPGPPDDVPQPCSNNAANFKMPNADTSQCNKFGRSDARNDVVLEYPDDFQYTNAVTHYVCPQSKKRIIRSNGITDHDVQVWNPNRMCVVNWHVELPLVPSKMSSGRKEVQRMGINAMALNGVPLYGATENDEASNAVLPTEDSLVQDANCWYGHASQQSHWHYHSPTFGSENFEAASDTLLGYALDGFPIYGPLSDEEAAQTDLCNGVTGSDGSYRYHIKTIPQVPTGNDAYCPSGSNPTYNQWNYILGCYKGDISNTLVKDSTQASLPSDCVEDVTMNELARDTDFRMFFQ